MFEKKYISSLFDYSLPMLVKFLFFLAMAVPAAISVVELEEVCVEREALLGRALEVWEKKIIEAFLQNERYKNMSKAERDKVILW